jgi:hypothetical protein
VNVQPCNVTLHKRVIVYFKMNEAFYAESFYAYNQYDVIIKKERTVSICGYSKENVFISRENHF